MQLHARSVFRILTRIVSPSGHRAFDSHLFYAIDTRDHVNQAVEQAKGANDADKKMFGKKMSLASRVFPSNEHCFSDFPLR
jgi:hypothetical protein